MRNFLIDTDTASDDAVAIMMALAEPKSERRSQIMAAAKQVFADAGYHGASINSIIEKAQIDLVRAPEGARHEAAAGSSHIRRRPSHH